MVKFLKENVLTFDADAGVFVIDVDLQGLWFGPEHSQFRDAFPKVYNLYRNICIHDYKNRLGTSILLEESGYKVALLVTKKTRKTKPEDALKYFESSIKHLFSIVPSDVFLFSPILARRDGNFNNYLVALSRLTGDTDGEAGRYWTICRGEGK